MGIPPVAPSRPPFAAQKGEVLSIGYDYWMQRSGEHPRYPAPLDSGFRRNDGVVRGNW